jgi:hypothetical protein
MRAEHAKITVEGAWPPSQYREALAAAFGEISKNFRFPNVPTAQSMQFFPVPSQPSIPFNLLFAYPTLTSQRA